MSMQALGKDIINFYENGWPGGAHIETLTGTKIRAQDGTLLLSPDVEYPLDRFGDIQRYCGESITFEEGFHTWLEKELLTTLTFTVLKKDACKVVRAIKKLNLKYDC